MSSQQSFQQVLQDVHVPADHALKVDAEVTAVIGDVEVSINSIDDNITIGDNSGNLAGTTAVGGNRGLNVNVINSTSVTGTVDTNLNGLNAFQTSQYTVGISAAIQLASSPLSGRSSIIIKAFNNTGIVYIGNSSGVTTSTGYPLFTGDAVEMDITSSSVIYAIASSANQNVAVLELG